jgi:hypothetical protein
VSLCSTPVRLLRFFKCALPRPTRAEILDVYRETLAETAEQKGTRVNTDEGRNWQTGEYAEKASDDGLGRISPPTPPRRKVPEGLNPYTEKRDGIGTCQQGGVTLEMGLPIRESLAGWLDRHPWWDFRPAVFRQRLPKGDAETFLDGACFRWHAQPSWGLPIIASGKERKYRTARARHCALTVVGMGTWAPEPDACWTVCDENIIPELDFTNGMERPTAADDWGVNAVCNNRERFPPALLERKRKPGPKPKEKIETPRRPRGRPPKDGIAAMSNKERKRQERARKNALKIAAE